MGAPRSLESELVRWSRLISLIGLVGLLLLALITVLEALLRWLLNLPIPGVSDVSALVVTLSVSACFPIVFASRSNITVRFVVDMLGPRGRAVLEVFGNLGSLFICCLLAWQLWVYAAELSSTKATTWIVLWPTAPWWYIAAFLVGLSIPVQLILIYLDLRSAFARKGMGDNEPEDHGEVGR